jgi:protein tyrosine phosphatase (PTP) superfamily phosphohydrolase (DUF442 family)
VGRTEIVCYRPKPGMSEALAALAAGHFARLYSQGLVTRRLSKLLRSSDGTLLEIFEWKSYATVEAARSHPAVLQLRAQFESACEYVPLAALPEAAKAFADFESAAVEVVRPPFFDVYNHVQVDARISTSGVITKPVVEEMVRQGYAGVINLLPDESPHALAGESTLVRGGGLAYHYIPVDFGAPSEAAYRAFEEAMEGFGSGPSIYVHCAANMRVSAFMAVYGKQCLGWSVDRARAHVAEVWKPDEVWSAFLDEHL